MANWLLEFVVSTVWVSLGECGCEIGGGFVYIFIFVSELGLTCQFFGFGFQNLGQFHG